MVISLREDATYEIGASSVTPVHIADAPLQACAAKDFSPLQRLDAFGIAPPAMPGEPQVKLTRDSSELIKFGYRSDPTASGAVLAVESSVDLNLWSSEHIAQLQGFEINPDGTRTLWARARLTYRGILHAGRRILQLSKGFALASAVGSQRKTASGMDMQCI